MKRTITALVEYEGSDEEHSDSSSSETPRENKKAKAPASSHASSRDLRTSPSRATQPPAARRRKLPSLASSLSGPAHVDDPAQHQGRVRTVPHVEGQWACHVYVPVTLKPRSTIRGVLEGTLRSAKDGVQRDTGMDALRTFWDAETPKPELHISLSRPIFVRTHQREELKREVRRVAKLTSPFTTSFTSFSVLTNDENTRTFLAVDVGAGHQELSAMTAKLTPFLRSIRQQEYYSDPKYHASIGWALLDTGSTRSSTAGPTDRTPATTPPDVPGIGPAPPPGASPGPSFPSITAFPDAVVDMLNAEYGRRIVKVGAVEVGRVCVKIGKEVSSWALEG
ncbi:hypothetical protein HDZ31DRAFT_79715 [Schizophyllum fasciatum]